MASINAIAESIKLIDIKKSNLHKTFTDLQSHSQILTSFLLQWNDLNNLITTIQNSFQSLLNSIQSNPPQFDPKHDAESIRVTPRPELKSYCVKMDGLGLRNFINNHPKERKNVKKELPEAIRAAADPAALVLGAMEGFYKANSKVNEKDNELESIRKICVLLLEALMDLNLEIEPEVKKRAKKLAVEWKGKWNVERNSLEGFGFIMLLASYGLGDEFDVNEVTDIFVDVARYKQAPSICRALRFIEKGTDVIQKLISNGKHVLAVKLIIEFGLRDKFPPVPFLKAHVMEAEERAQKIRDDGSHSYSSISDAHGTELNSIQSVIRCIRDHNLESEYSPKSLEERIKKLRKQLGQKRAEMHNRQNQLMEKRSRRKRSAPNPKHSGDKRPRNDPPATSPPSPYLSSSAEPYGLTGPDSPVPVPHYAGSSAGLYDLVGSTPSVAAYAGSTSSGVPYGASSSGLYGLVGSTPSVAPYAGSTSSGVPYGASSSGLYGLSGQPASFPGNFSPVSRPHQFPSESYPSSSYLDRAPAHGRYSLGSQYHPSYYPQ